MQTKVLACHTSTLGIEVRTLLQAALDEFNHVQTSRYDFSTILNNITYAQRAAKNEPDQESSEQIISFLKGMITRAYERRHVDFFIFMYRQEKDLPLKISTKSVVQFIDVLMQEGEFSNYEIYELVKAAIAHEKAHGAKDTKRILLELEFREIKLMWTTLIGFQDKLLPLIERGYDKNNAQELLQEICSRTYHDIESLANALQALGEIKMLLTDVNNYRIKHQLLKILYAVDPAHDHMRIYNQLDHLFEGAYPANPLPELLRNKEEITLKWTAERVAKAIKEEDHETAYIAVSSLASSLLYSPKKQEIIRQMQDTVLELLPVNQQSGFAKEIMMICTAALG